MFFVFLTMLTRFLPILFIGMLIAGCVSPTDSDSEDPSDTPMPREVSDDDYSDLGDGLKYYDFQVGTGDSAKVNDVVSVHYSGWLTNNTLFDSSYLRDPFVFRLGTGSVIQGWDQGLLGMQVGGERQLVIPSELAYGAQGRGPIPPNATLVFEVILVSTN